MPAASDGSSWWVYPLTSPDNGEKGEGQRCYALAHSYNWPVSLYYLVVNVQLLG